jgi:hypothetical protein
MALAAVAAPGIAACDGMAAQARMVVGGPAGAASGRIAADLPNADRNRTITAALGGAAAGALVARNRATGRCAHATGDCRSHTPLPPGPAPCRTAAGLPAPPRPC